jgi:hypothetical protein
MTLPIILIVMGAVYWPVTLVLALLAAALGARLRGGWRAVCFVIACVLLAVLALGVPLLADWRTAGSASQVPAQ